MSTDTTTVPATAPIQQVAINDIGTEEDFLAAIDKTIKYFNDGDIVEGTIEALKEKDEPVKGTVIEVVKGGLILDIGLRGFLPASLVEMRRVRDLQPYVGRELEAKIIELDKNRNNVVLSRRAWLEQTQSEVRSEFLNQLQKGQ
ncbi:MAG TPA: S1 RNA-binding domain-containing protein, partial [Pseudonocardiaceae bacterium]|nr:S1 RNA-binding domain-containing protein [Pseudonocardiaceae bacterium]